eukprot:6034887-Pyramimonas_sp.AAC.2
MQVLFWGIECTLAVIGTGGPVPSMRKARKPFYHALGLLLPPVCPITVVLCPTFSPFCCYVALPLTVASSFRWSAGEFPAVCCGCKRTARSVPSFWRRRQQQAFAAQGTSTTLPCMNQ